MRGCSLDQRCERFRARKVRFLRDLECALASPHHHHAESESFAQRGIVGGGQAGGVPPI